tara:strand:- start:4519 stop:4785 length:267 start_codon:yes stop_codon:yes gene_type:complete
MTRTHQFLIARNEGEAIDADGQGAATWQKVGVADFWTGGGFSFSGRLVTEAEWQTLESAAQQIVWGKSAVGFVLEPIGPEAQLRIDLM